MSSPQSSANDLRDAFFGLSQLLQGARPLVDTLQGIVDLAKHVIPGTVDVSVTMLSGTQARTVVFTGPLATELDERQYAAGFGPCMDAAGEGRTVHVSTADDKAYPEFARISRDAGVTHVLSLGLPVPGRTVGALNTYLALPGELDETDIELATSFASFAAVAVANAAAASGMEHLDEEVQSALRSRNMIEQATAMVMARDKISATAAFDAMVATSRQQDCSLRDVAQSIVDGVGGERAVD